MTSFLVSLNLTYLTFFFLQHLFNLFYQTLRHNNANGAYVLCDLHRVYLLELIRITKHIHYLRQFVTNHLTYLDAKSDGL